MTLAGCALAGMAAPGHLQAQQEISEKIEAAIFRPAVAKPSEEAIASLKVPAGFHVSIFAKELKNPRMMAVLPDGGVYVTRRAPQNDVLLLKDADGDGTADAPITVARIPDVHGITIKDGKIYLAAVRELYVGDIAKDGSLENIKPIYEDLPDAGQHPNRTLAFSPDGELYLSVGSTCNAAPEANPESATMLKVKTDGSERMIFARGLRNTIGFDWNPKTGELWGLDHGIDWLGNDTQREELNKLEEGGNYGWPFVFENGKPNLADNPKEMTGLSWEEYAKKCKDPTLTYTAHAAPMSLLFYRGEQFPAEFSGDAFATFHGSWNRGAASGYELTRIKFRDGNPVSIEPFITGFYSEADKSHFGRPCGLALAPDGSLLMSDDGGGIIYRITYDKNRTTGL